MRIIYTSKILLLILVVFSAGIFACSSNNISNAAAGGDKTFTFINSADGVKYEVTFDKDNNITSIKRNEEEVPENEFSEYEDVIFSNLDEIQGNRTKNFVYHIEDFPGDDSGSVPHIYEYEDNGFDKEIIITHNGDSTKGHVYKYRTEFPKFKKRVHIEKWNDSTFKHEMKMLNDEVVKLKDVKIKMNFDSDKFKRDMKIFRQEFNENLNEELEDLNEEISNITKELKENRFDELIEIDVDIPDIEIELQNLDRKMGNLDKEMSKVKTEMKKFDGFTKELRSELYKDKIIENKDEDFSLNFSSESMKVNDKEIPADLVPKYKQLYKKHFGKEMGKKERFEIKN